MPRRPDSQPLFHGAVSVASPWIRIRLRKGKGIFVNGEDSLAAVVSGVVPPSVRSRRSSGEPTRSCDDLTEEGEG